MVTLPNRDQHGNIVMAGRLIDGDVSKFCYEDCLTMWYMLQDITLRENGTVPGFTFVLDMKGASLGHIAKISLASLKKYYMYIQVCSSKHIARVTVTTCCHGKSLHKQQSVRRPMPGYAINDNILIINIFHKQIYMQYVFITTYIKITNSAVFK
jgi:hypothetical protein